MTNRIDSSHIERLTRQYQPIETDHAVQDSFRAAMQRVRTNAGSGANNSGSFMAWEDCVRRIRIEFNGPATSKLSAEETAQFKARFQEDPTVENMWRILGEMTQMEALDGEAVYDEMMQFYRNEQCALQYGGSAAQFDVHTLISGLDTAVRSGETPKETEKAALLEAVRLIAGA